jgi:hypothetical protein
MIKVRELTMALWLDENGGKHRWSNSAVAAQEQEEEKVGDAPTQKF